jgi:two-component system CheB/CheR fusion protein
MEAVCVKDLIDEVTASINNKISTTNAVITTDFEVEELFFSKKNLRSIIYNLITNALKFTKSPTPTIKISTKSEGEFVLLSVRDNGIGMTLKEKKKVFDIYNRINKNVEGQGIGLYLVKKIVDAAGGKVMIESEPGKGTTFKIFLLAEQQPAGRKF